MNTRVILTTIAKTDVYCTISLALGVEFPENSTLHVHWRIQGACSRHAPSTGLNFFVFAHIFVKKCSHQGSTPPQWVHTPPNGSTPPTGNPGSTTDVLSLPSVIDSKACVTGAAKNGIFNQILLGNGSSKKALQECYVRTQQLEYIDCPPRLLSRVD